MQYENSVIKSLFCYSYCFQKKNIPENYSVHEESGVLMPNEIKFNLWKFMPQMPGEHLATVKCETHVVQNGKKVGESADVIVTVLGCSQYVELIVSTYCTRVAY